MALPSNLISATGSNDGSTYFNNFFTLKFPVSSDVDATLVAEFEKITDSREAAQSLASAVLYTSQAQGLDPIAVMQDFVSLIKEREKDPVLAGQGIDPNSKRGKLEAYITMFLNLNRVGTSYLGYRLVPNTNKYVQRSILP